MRVVIADDNLLVREGIATLAYLRPDGAPPAAAGTTEGRAPSGRAPTPVAPQIGASGAAGTFKAVT